MCDMEGISEVDWKWDCAVGESQSQVVHWNGRDYEMTILRGDSSLAKAIYHFESHGCTLENRSISTAKIGGSAEGRVGISWGDKDGVKYEAGSKVKIHDEEGNYARVEVEGDSTGRGNAEVVVGRKE